MDNHTKRSPRVLIVVENLPYPADRRVRLEAAALREAGYDVAVISPKGQGRWTASHEQIDGVAVYRFPLPPAASGIGGYLAEYGAALLGITRLTLHVLHHQGFDILQVCNPPDLFFPLGFLARLFGKRFIFDQHDLTPETFAVRFAQRGSIFCLALKLLYLCEWLTYRAASVVMVPNESLRSIARSRGGIPGSKAFVVRNGPNEERRRIVPPDPSLKCGRRFLACYVGMMGLQDGVDVAIWASDWIVHNAGRTDVTFAFLGDGDQLPHLKQLARDLDLEEYVVFPGFVGSETLSSYLCTSDVGLAPDPQNGLNEYASTIKVMEYMAVGLPVVAFDLPETRASALDAGVYAEPNDHTQFGQLILDLLDDPERRKLLGARGRTRIRESLSWENARQRLLVAYRAALGRQQVQEAGLSSGSND